MSTTTHFHLNTPESRDTVMNTDASHGRLYVWLLRNRQVIKAEVTAVTATTITWLFVEVPLITKNYTVSKSNERKLGKGKNEKWQQ